MEMCVLPFVCFGGLAATDVLEHKNLDIAARKHPIQIAIIYRYKPNTRIPQAAAYFRLVL
jgi:hypothetical protein